MTQGQASGDVTTRSCSTLPRCRSVLTLGGVMIEWSKHHDSDGKEASSTGADTADGCYDQVYQGERENVSQPSARQFNLEEIPPAARPRSKLPDIDVTVSGSERRISLQKNKVPQYSGLVQIRRI